MDEIKFTINNRVEIIYEDSIYKSNIQDAADNFIAISIPIKEGKYITLNSTDYFEVMYYDETNVYIFEGKVMWRRVENGVPQILLEYPRRVNKVQRREYVRIDITQYINYVKLQNNIITESAIEQLDSEKGSKGLLIDLSGGGLKVKLSESIWANSILLMDIPDEGGKIRVKGKVVRVGMDKDKRPVCGLSFIDIDNRTRERIIKLIFSTMRKQRKTV
jgi:c-di-GMP-binding flagellar brake protein YcgR